MRHTRTVAASAALLAAVLAGCTAQAVTTTDSTSDSASVGGTAAAQVAEAADVHDTSEALTWEEEDETAIALDGGTATVAGADADADGATVTITAAGIYRVTGTLDDGAIVVDTADEGIVRIVLDGAHVTSSTTSPLQVTAADQVVVVLADGSSNTLEDAAEYVYPDTETDEPNAALFSAADLTLGGDGSLSVTGNSNDGIASKDGLVILSGTIEVTAADDGIRGKDYLVVRGGALTVDAADDGLKSDNVEDAGRGVIAIEGGSVTVAAGDDAVKAERALTISGGSVDVTASVEGLESEVVEISGGSVSVVSSDDGINGAAADTAQTPGGEFSTDDGVSVTISGGIVVIDAEGDGLDSNGDLTISGGTVVVHGPTRSGNGALDVNGTFDVTGGVVLAAGAAGMAQTPDANSSQSFVSFTVAQAVDAGSVLQVLDSSGTVVATFEAAKAVGNVVFSAPEVEAGAEYRLAIGGTTSGDSTGGLYGGGSAEGTTVVGTATAGTASPGMGGGMGGGMGRAGAPGTRPGQGT